MIEFEGRGRNRQESAERAADMMQMGLYGMLDESVVYTAKDLALIGVLMKRFFRTRAKKSYLPITTEEIELIDLLLNGERKEADDDKLKAEMDAAVLNINTED